MKILLGADQYPEYINGAATFTARLAAGLAAAGHTVDLLWPSANGEHHTYLDGGVRVHRLGSIALPGRPRMQVCSPRTANRQIDQIVQIVRPDVVHVQSHLGLGRALVRAAVCNQLPVMATNHFMPENLLHHVPVVRRFPHLAAKAAWWDLERVFADADLLSAPTGRAVELLAASTGLPRAEAISCGIELSRYADLGPADATGAPGEPTVLFVGRLEQEKNLDELLRAFALVPRSTRARLELVGMGSLRGRLEALADELGVAASVTFAGAVSDDELLAAYGRADLFVMPGTAELQSLATLEAMAAGRPVVAADAMALPHLVRDGENGFLYAPGDAAGLARRITRLASDPGLRQEFGAASRRIAERHSLGATVSAFEACYGRMLTSRLAVAEVDAGFSLVS